MPASHIDRLAADRIETRFMGTTPLGSPPEGIHELAYPDTQVSTIYFGTDSLTEPVPEGVGLRFRYRLSEEPAPDHVVAMVDPSQVGTLELKRDFSNGTTERTTKRYLPGVTFDEATAILGNPLGQSDTGGEHADFLEETTRLFQGEATKPLVLHQSKRRHFLLEGAPVRLTLDTHISLWLMSHARHIGVFALRAQDLDYDILEIKSLESLTSLAISPEGLICHMFGEDSDFAPRTGSKRSVTEMTVKRLGFPSYTREGFQSSGQPHVYSFHERELKLDASHDPRNALQAIPPKMGDIYLAPKVGTDIRFRNHVIDDLKIIEKGADDAFSASAFQHKYLVEADQPDQLTRFEVTDTSLLNLLTTIGRTDLLPVLAESGLRTSPVFAIRHRLQCRAVSLLTGKVFVLLADHCEASDGRPPLDQLEIEYLGRVAFTGDELSDPDTINDDFNRLSNLLHSVKEFGELHTSKRTKWDWLEQP